MNICVRSAADATKTTCRTPKDPQTQMPNPLYNPFSNNQDGGGGGSIDGIQQPINVIEPDGPPLTDETTAPIEKGMFFGYYQVLICLFFLVLSLTFFFFIVVLNRQ